MLVRARQVVNTTLHAEAIILRKSSVSDSAGGFNDTYASIGTFPCSYARHQVSPFEREATVSVQMVALFNFVFEAGTDIRPTDRIVTDNRTFEVVSGAAASIVLVTRVVAQEIQ